MDKSILRKGEVRKRTGLANSTIYLLISRNQFPKQVPLGVRSVGWISSEIDAWIESRISQREAA